VAYRNQNGPFKSIYDLYRVPEFQQVSNNLVTSAMMPSPDGKTKPTTANGSGEPNPLNGDFSPGGIPSASNVAPYTTDSVRFDYKERFLLLNNISNLITTRSDTFTCYILLQGWRNVGTNNPTLAVQRRAAYILDRNGVTPSNNVPSYFKVPTD
jgi:hypothetical protein